MRMWLLWTRLKNRNTDVAGYGTSSQTTSGNGNLERFRAMATWDDFGQGLPRAPSMLRSPFFLSPPHRRDAATVDFVTP